MSILSGRHHHFWYHIAQYSDLSSKAAVSFWGGTAAFSNYVLLAPMNKLSARFEAVLLGLTVLYLLALAGVPLVYTVFLSFQDIDPFQINRLIHRFVGFQNFQDIFSDPFAPRYFLNTLIFLLISVSTQFLIGFGLALIFKAYFFGGSIVRGLFLVAWILPPIAVGIIWVSLFAQKAGVLNFALVQSGLVQDGIGWLTTSQLSLISVSIANVWLGVPFNMIFLTIGLMAIPDDMYEAARMDGANAWNRFRFITLPAMRASIATMLSLGVIFTLQQFDLFAAMTNGGPAGSSTVLQYWSWRLSFETLEIGKGAAVASLTLVLVMVIGAIYIIFSREDEIR